MTLNEGDTAPGFTLQNSEGTPVSLSELNREGSVLLLFFPLAFTGTCTEELCTARDNMKFYESLQVQVAGISVDSFHVLREYRKAHNLNFPLLSDFNKEVSKRYGALYEDFYGMKGVSKRASFVIDPQGVVRFAEVLEDAGRLPDFDAIQSAL